MKITRRQLRRLILKEAKSLLKEEYTVPGYRDRPPVREYTIDHNGSTLVLDTFDAGSKIIVTFLDEKDSEGNPVRKRYKNEGVKTSITWPGGKHRIKLSSLR